MSVYFKDQHLSVYIRDASNKEKAIVFPKVRKVDMEEIGNSSFLHIHHYKDGTYESYFINCQDIVRFSLSPLSTSAVSSKAEPGKGEETRDECDSN